MVKWITKINWLKVLLIGFLYTIFAEIIHIVESMLTMKYYLMPQYFGLWSKIMMPKAGPPPAEFYINSIIITFVAGVSITLVYYYLRDFLPTDFKKRVFMFADLLVALGFVFFTLTAYLMFNIPVGLLVSWFISSFIIILATSFLLVKIIK